MRKVWWTRIRFVSVIREMRAIAVFCLMAVCSGVESNLCPTQCFCSLWNGLVKTDCSRRNFINTFLPFSHRTQILDLSLNTISVLHGNEFLDANLKHVQDLSLSNNRLHKIDKLTFNGLELLQTLDLSANSIEYLNPATFKYNPNLKTLNVSYNPLVLRGDGPFLFYVASLQVLDVTHCLLDVVGSRGFSQFENLSVLNISSNVIRQLGFLESLRNLKYLDATDNDITCDDQTKAQLLSLTRRKVQFKLTSCRVSDKSLEMNRLGYYQEGNSTERLHPRRSFLQDLSSFLQSIPSFYAILCGIQLGIFIGSLATYFCLRKSVRRHIDERRHSSGESDNFNLIPLHTPPGTPPSPYRSRFFPSTFSLPAT